MRFFTPFAFAGLALFNLVTGAAINVDNRSIEELEKRGPLAMAEPGIVLRPVKRQLYRRDDLSGFDPREEDSFLYGDPDDGEQSPLASMTITMEDGRQIVSMERFEGHTKSVQCGEKMVLDFVSKEAFEYAIEAWGWVNEKEDKSFVMIANHEGCGESFERTPYHVYDVDYDDEKFITYLYARQMQWTDIKGDMTLDFGSLEEVPDTPDSPEPSPAPIEGLTKRWGDVSKSASVSVNAAKSLGSSKTVWASSIKGLDLSLDCINCGTKGKFDISGRIKVNLFKLNLKELSVQAKPKGFQARLELELTADGVIKKFQDEKQLLSVGLPGSISIPKIFKLGASLDYDIGMTASIDGKATISYGLIGKLPNKAIVKVDVKNPSKSKFSGWSPTFQTIPMKANAEISGNLAVYSQPGLSLGFNVLNKFGYEAALKMRLPEVATTLKVKTDKNGGQCGVKANKVGLNVGASVGVDLSFRVGEDKSGGKTLYSKRLFQTRRNLYNKCFGFRGSGSGDGTKNGSGGKKPKKTAAPKKATKKPAPTKKVVPKPKKTEKAKKKPTHPTKKPTKKPTNRVTVPTKTTKANVKKTTTAKANPKTTKKSVNKNTTTTRKVDDKKTTTKPRTTTKPKTTRKYNDNKTKTTKKTKSHNTQKDATKFPPTTTSRHSSSSIPSVSATVTSSANSSGKPQNSSYSRSVSSFKSSASAFNSTSIASSSAAPSSTDACELYYATPSEGSIAPPRSGWLVPREPAQCAKKIECSGLEDPDDTTGLRDDDLNRNSNKHTKTPIEFSCYHEEKKKNETYKVEYEDYPSPGNAAHNYPMVAKYFDYHSSSCYNWTVERRDKPRKKAYYQTEHVYEAQMVRDFINYLHYQADNRPTCAQIEKMFFTSATDSEGRTTSGAQKIARHIANVKYKESMYAATILLKGINRQKAGLWLTNNLIGKDHLDKGEAKYLFKRIKEIGAAIYYMENPQVKKMMGCTLKAINKELDDMEASDIFEENHLKGFNLKGVNNAYLKWAYGNANRRSREAIQKAAQAILRGKRVLAPGDKAYVQNLADGIIPLPKDGLKVPTEKDAENCAPGI